MFLLRSAFWLTAAYLVLAPNAGTDMGSAAQAMGTSVTQSAPRIAAAGLSQLSCESIECAAGRAVAIGALAQAENGATPAHKTAPATPATGMLAEAAVTARTAPIPPLRPDWAG